MKDESSRAKSGFTLIELLVVIAIIAVLAALLLPVMAAAKRRSRVTQCQNNFHQVYVASFVYANDYHDYFPIYASIGTVNFFNLVSDTSYVVHNVATAGGLPPHTVVNPGIQPDVFQNLGLLYVTRMIGDGKALYCPGYPATSIFSAARFSSKCQSSLLTQNGQFGRVWRYRANYEWNMSGRSGEGKSDGIPSTRRF